jgi:hypothetical protein
MQPDGAMARLLHLGGKKAKTLNDILAVIRLTQNAS